MLNTWVKFWRLPADSKRVVVRSALILPATFLGLKIYGFRRLMSRIQQSGPLPAGVSEERMPEVRACVNLFSAVARRYPLPMKCLGRSVALCWFLRQRGIDAAVHVGVRKEQKQQNFLDAHAWVQAGDFVINDTPDVSERYARVLPTYSKVESIR